MIVAPLSDAAQHYLIITVMSWYTPGLALISTWSQSDHREYMAITCDQVQAWSWPLTLLVLAICWPGIWQPWLIARYTVGRMGACHSISSRLCVIRRD